MLVADPQAPRNSWPMGIVQELNIGNQGLVRSVKVKTQFSTLVRPITKIVLLLEQDQWGKLKTATVSYTTELE